MHPSHRLVATWFDFQAPLSGHTGWLLAETAAARLTRLLGPRYALVGFEIFILSASIHVLVHGARSVTGAAEAAAHSLCVLGGLAAFAAFYYESYRIDRDGYNAAVQAEVQVRLDSFLL